MPEHWRAYILVAVVGQLIVRAIMAALRCLERRYPPLYPTAGIPIPQPRAHREHRFAWNFLRDFGGWHPDEAQRDYWHPSILGGLELLAYPILLNMQHWEVIGAWIGLKTVAKWGEWTTNRGSYNRFLIGNALIAFLAFAISRWTWMFDS